MTSEQRALRPSATTSDMADMLGLQSYDCAMPIQFMRQFKEVTGHDPRGSLVFCYDDNSMGAPRPLTAECLTALETFNEEVGCQFPTDLDVVEWKVIIWEPVDEDETRFEPEVKGQYYALESAKTAALGYEVNYPEQRQVEPTVREDESI